MEEPVKITFLNFFLATHDLCWIFVGFSLGRRDIGWFGGTMAEVRATIELLAVILKENGVAKAQIPAEIFRVAKFDEEQAVCTVVTNNCFEDLRVYACCST